MVFKGKDPAVQANITASANERADRSSDRTSSSSSDKGEVIYTPPESVSSMSTIEGVATVAPTATSLLTAMHGLVLAPVSTAANISIREYIYFLPYPLPPDTPVPYSTGLPHRNPLNLPPHQFEPTTTLVLTSPNRTFVDVRLFKPFPVDAATMQPNKGEKERMEWGFAGSSESHPVPTTQSAKDGNKPKKTETKQWEGITHSIWTHWLDSRYPVGSANIPVDEGDMYPIADDLTLEHGHAFQPLMHAHKTHEEMWRDVDIRSTNSSRTKICVVLRLHADAVGVRGVIIRLGQYCQGIVMKDAHCTVERWEFVAKDRSDAEEATKWKRTARIGDQLLPCTAAFRPEVLALGGVVKYHDYEWVVEECWEWK